MSWKGSLTVDRFLLQISVLQYRVKPISIPRLLIFLRLIMFSVKGEVLSETTLKLLIYSIFLYEFRYLLFSPLKFHYYIHIPPFHSLISILILPFLLSNPPSPCTFQLLSPLPSNSIISAFYLFTSVQSYIHPFPPSS